MITILSIPGIHCEGCASLIKDVSSEFPSIKNIVIDISTKKVTLNHDESFDRRKWTEEIEALDSKYKIHPTV